VGGWGVLLLTIILYGGCPNWMAKRKFLCLYVLTVVSVGLKCCFALLNKFGTTNLVELAMVEPG